MIVTKIGSVRRNVCKRLILQVAIREVGPTLGRLISNIVERSSINSVGQ